jgi:predicted protein tyrosine phosphatase
LNLEQKIIFFEKKNTLHSPIIDMLFRTKESVKSNCRGKYLINDVFLCHNQKGYKTALSKLGVAKRNLGVATS